MKFKLKHGDVTVVMTKQELLFVYHNAKEYIWASDKIIHVKEGIIEITPKAQRTDVFKSFQLREELTEEEFKEALEYLESLENL